MVEDLIKRIAEKCAGRDRWYVMNEAEDGYCMDFGHQLDADRWMADRMRENPDYIKRNGYHIVKQRSFTPAEELANAAAARIAELEHEAGFTKPIDAADASYPNALAVAQTLRNCTQDLHTEARFVLWQSKRLTALESERDALLAAAGKEAVAAAPVGFMMKHKTGMDIGFAWKANDPQFSQDWIRIPLYTAPTAALENGDGRGAAIDKEKQS
jgi:hypothetical protein